MKKTKTKSYCIRWVYVLTIFEEEDDKSNRNFGISEVKILFSL